MKYLIAGLGNIGVEYQNTRHNIGFDVINALAKSFDVSFELRRLAHLANFKFKSRNFYLIKPTTLVNRSGKAINYWLQTLELPISNLLVVVDDTDLPFGKLRLKGKGADNGHNGMIHITDTLGSDQFPRIRFGIGNDFYEGEKVNYVLGEWAKEEQEILPEKIEIVAEMIKSFGTIGLERTMNQFN